jgi:hypothetical protein
MKKIFLALISLLILITSACQKDDIPPCSYPKNARLKCIVHCFEPNLDCPTMECEGTIEREYEYDRMGRIEKVMIRPRYEDGVLERAEYYHLYDYDSEGRLVNIEYHHQYVFRDSLVDWHEKNHIYSYSDDGKKIREYIDWMESDSFQYKFFKYTYNRLTRIENYKKDSDELENYILYEYDNSGNLVKETTYNKYDVPVYHTTHIYENGLNVESNRHGIGIIKTYDDNNNLILLETFYQSGSSKGNERLKYEYFL